MMKKKEGKAIEKKKKDQELPIRYVRQPSPMTEISADFTLKQTQILVEMTDALREKVDDLFNKNKQPRLLFSEEDFDDDGNTCIDIPLSSLTTRPDEYGDIEKVAKQLFNAYIETDEIDGKRITHVFTEVFLPTKVGKGGRVRRTGSIRFILSRYQAKRLFNFTRYSKYIKAIARNSKSTYTARLYMIIANERFRVDWKVDYLTLRQRLGADVYDEAKKRYVIKKYRDYKNFKNHVIVIAERELKSLAESGEADCFFEFSEDYESDVIHKPGGQDMVYEDDDPAGLEGPKAIVFHIKTTALGELEDKKSKSTIKYIAIEHNLREKFQLTSADCQQLFKKMVDDNLDEVEKCIQRIEEAIAAKGDKITDKRKYALTSLHNELDNLVPLAEDVVEVKTDSREPEKERHASDKFKITDEQIVLFSSLEHEHVDPNWHNAMKLDEVGEDKVVIRWQAKSYLESFVKEFGKEPLQKILDGMGRKNLYFVFDI